MAASGTPVAFLLAFLFVIGLFNCVLAKKYKPVDVEIKPTADGKPQKVFTPDEMAKFDGSDPEKPIYLGVRGVVFDVSAGKDFYSKGSGYNALAGKDASRGHALWSLEPADLTHDLSGLTDEQLEGLDQVFTGTYLAKYPVVGYMSYLIEEKARKTDGKKKQPDEL